MVKKIILGLILILLNLSVTFGQERDSVLNAEWKNAAVPEAGKRKESYLLVYSGQYDMAGSAQNFLSLSRLLGHGIDNWMSQKDTITGFYRMKGLGERILGGFAANFLFTNWLSIIQHEYMGHGYRIRENNVHINRYVMPPAGWGGNAYVDFNKNDLSYYEKLLYSAGGSESNTIFARESYRQNLLNDYIFHYNINSMLLKIDLPAYILGGDTPHPGSEAYNASEFDVVYYIKTFVKKSGTTEKTIYESAKKGAYWALADPSMLLSFFNYVRDYLIKGKTRIKNPMIEIKKIYFLPFTDFHLSPFGYEYYIGSYFKHKERLVEIYYRRSTGNIDGKSNGFGINIMNLYKSLRLRLDAGLHVWNQGFNILYYETDKEKYNKDVHSAKINVTSFYTISKSTSILGQVSFKGEGFLLGNPVKKGFNGKIGAGFNF